jgi:hypothetical protein
MEYRPSSAAIARLCPAMQIHLATKTAKSTLTFHVHDRLLPEHIGKLGVRHFKTSDRGDPAKN